MIDDVALDNTTAIQESEAEKIHGKIFPNPVTDDARLFINLKQNIDLQVQVINTLGQIVLLQSHSQLAVGQHALDIDTRQLPAGIYYVKVQSGTGAPLTLTFVKQ